MLTGLITIVGGILAASALIIARKPNAKELIDKITPYQGWIGIAMFAWGIYATITVVSNLGWLVQAWGLVYTIAAIAAATANLVVGFLLGFGLITKYALTKNPVALARGQQIRARLVAYQATFGLLAIASGALFTVLHVIH